MRQFISAMSPSGLVLEVTDFDSPFIIAEPKALTVSPGASSRCYTQVAVPNQPPGWVTLPPASFANLTSFGGVPHSCIGFMMYYTAMLTSAIL
jgi:hypothetical protein